jgi:hypothetical protein
VGALARSSSLLDGASYPCRILGDFDLAGISVFEYKKAGGCEIARRQ